VLLPLCLDFGYRAMEERRLTGMLRQALKPSAAPDHTAPDRAYERLPV
jgi:hypothetical protein